MAVASRLRGWLPPQPGVRALVTGSFVDALGTGLFLAGSALFFSRALHLSPVQIGLGLSLGGLAGVLGIVPVGRLADRTSGKWTLVGLYLFRGGCFVAYPFAGTPAVFYLVAFLIGAAEFGGGPIVQSLVGGMVGDAERVRTMGVNATVRNAGFAIGAVVATAAVSLARPSVFVALVLVDAATFLATAALFTRLPHPPRQAGPRQGAEQPVPATPARPAARVLTPRFVGLAAVNAVLFLHAPLLSVALPLWIATDTRAPTFVVGLVVVVNTVLAIALQVPLGGRLEQVRAAAWRQRFSGLALAATCCCAAFAASVGAAVSAALMVAAAAALTLGEIWQLSGSWRLAFALAPPERRASYVAVYEIGPSVATAAGPFLLTWAVLRNGTAGWLGLAAVFVLVATAVVPLAAGVRESPGQPGTGDEPADVSSSFAAEL